MRIRKPTDYELLDCEMVDLTKDEIWKPCDMNNDDGDLIQHGKGESPSGTGCTSIQY